MNTRYALEQAFKTTLAKVLDFIGVNREIIICDEDHRIYVQDGITKGGFPVAMVSDHTLEVRGIPFKGPDPQAGETWIFGEWPSDEDPLVLIPAYVAGPVGGGASAFDYIDQEEQGFLEFSLSADNFAENKIPFVRVAAIGNEDTVTINLPVIPNLPIGSQVIIQKTVPTLGVVKLLPTSGVNIDYAPELTFTTRGNMILRYMGEQSLGPSGSAQMWKPSFELMFADQLNDGRVDVKLMEMDKPSAFPEGTKNYEYVMKAADFVSVTSVTRTQKTPVIVMDALQSDETGVISFPEEYPKQVFPKGAVIHFVNTSEGSVRFSEATKGNTTTSIVNKLTLNGKGVLTAKKIQDGAWLVSANANPSSGGGGSSIVLQQNGKKIVEAASVLNFGDGIYVNEDGLVSTLPAASLEWSVDISGPSPLINITNPTVNGSSWTGAAGAGFSSVPAVGLGSAIKNNTYFEITMPAKAGDFSAILLMPSKPTAEGFLVPPAGENYSVVSVQGGKLGSTPAVNDLGLNESFVSDFMTYGIEIDDSGAIFYHRDNVRTKIHAGIIGPLSLVSMTADTAAGAANTFTLNPSPTLPSSVSAGVVTLADAEDKQHPFAVWGVDEPLPEKITLVERAAEFNNLPSSLRFYSPQDIAQLILKHSRISVTAPVLNTSPSKVGINHIVFKSSDNSVRMYSTYRPGDERELEINMVANLPAVAPLGTSEQVTTNPTSTIKRWSALALSLAIKKSISDFKTSYLIYVSSSGGFTSSDLDGTGILSIQKKSDVFGSYEINFNFTGDNVHIQPDSGNLTKFTTLQGKNGNRLYLKFYDDATGAPVDVAFTIMKG